VPTVRSVLKPQASRESEVTERNGCQSVSNESVKPPSTILWDTSRQLFSASTDARPAYTTLAEQAHFKLLVLVQHKAGVRGAGSGSGKAGALAASCGVVQFQTARYQ
jgi:hypothetical protein